MYLPAHFKSSDPAATADLIRAYPFASLISAILAEQDEEWMSAKIYLNMKL